MNRNFFIAGGTGLIGRALVRRLLSQTQALAIDNITLLSRDPEKFARIAPDLATHRTIHILRGDLSNVEFPANRYTDIIHAAADINDLQVQNRFAYFWTIVSGTKRLLDFAQQVRCERFLYLSSGAVYGGGNYPETGIPENWPTAPALDDNNSTYGQAKRASEHLCTLFARQSGSAVRIARIFSIVGEEMQLDGQYALGNFIRDALSEARPAITVNGNGTPVRSYLHIEDVAAWLLQIHALGAQCDVFNVGSEIKIDIRQLAQMVSDQSTQRKKVTVMQQDSDYATRSVYVPDCSHARTTLGLKQTIALDAAVKRILNLHQRNS